MTTVTEPTPTRRGRPIDPESPSLVLHLDPIDGIKDELAEVSKETGRPARDIAVDILLYCRGRYQRINDHVTRRAASEVVK